MPVDGRPAGQLALEAPGLLGLEAVLLAPCLTTAIHFAVCVSQRLIQNCSLFRICSVREILICWGATRQGTGNREQGTGMAAAAWIMKSYTMHRRRPFRMNTVVASMSPLQGFQGFLASFYRGNVPFVLVVSYRARLFLFPVPCSLCTSLCISANTSTNPNSPAKIYQICTLGNRFASVWGRKQAATKESM